MAAIITSIVLPVLHPITGAVRGSVTGASRDDLYLGDVVTISAPAGSTSYAWTLVYKPEGSAAAFSGDVTTEAPGSITLDLEGPYMVRLTVDLGLPTETSQFVRLRWLTEFGQLTLVAAGEENNSGIPIPVDQTSDGWTNDQNRNIKALLNFVSKVSTSGRVLYVDQNGDPTDTTRGYGNYEVIQDAINFAVTQTPSATDPWVVLVRPGLYTEDLAFAAHVHVYGWPGASSGEATNRTVRLRNANGSHTVALSNAGDQTVLANMTLENPTNGTIAVVNKTGVGKLRIYRCALTNQGVDASQGPAIRAAGGDVDLIGCQLFLNPAAGDGQPAIRVANTGTTVNLTDCVVTGPTGLVAEEDTTVLARDTQFTGTGTGLSTGVLTDALSCTLEYCNIRAPLVTHPLQAHTSAAALAGSMALYVRWTRIEDGGILYDSTGVAGTSTLKLGAVEYTTLTLTAAPDVFEATVKAKSIYYDNAVTGIAAEDVQDAIDQVHALATAVQTLDDAYDGGVGGGIGRTITADSGAVQIIGTGTPTDPPAPADTDGQLQVVSNVQIGAIGSPEIDLDPNPYGNGALISMGRFIAANNTPFGSTVGVLAKSTGTPDFNNYNLRLQTESTAGGSLVGRLILRGGDGLANGAGTPLASSIYIQAGNTLAGPNNAGDVFLAPGDAPGAGSAGNVVFVRPQDATPAVLTASGAFVGGVAGTIRFATNMGALEVDITVPDTLGTTLTKLAASGMVTAIDAGGGVIELSTTATGPNAEVHYLNDTVGGLLDTAVGGFDGQSQTDGTWPSTIAIRVTANQEITIGAGAANPMIYDAITGKLTVPGLIDPTGLILDQNVPLDPGAGKGILFIGDGTSGTTQGNFYYRYETGSLQDITLAVIGSSGFAVEDEGVAVPNGPFTALNFTGAAVTATDAGGGKVQIAVTAGGGSVAGVAQEKYDDTDFTFSGGVSKLTLAATPDTNASLVGFYMLFRNSVLDMDNVSPAMPTTGSEYRINGSDLEIGANITTSSNEYRIVYPTT
jgi:hypothetical protein